MKKYQKAKALEILKALKVDPKVITDFEKDQVRCLTRFYDLAVSPDSKVKQKINEIEKRFNVLVYGVIYGEFYFGETFNFLIVPDDPEEWDLIFRQGKNENIVYAYVWNYTKEEHSEFGSICVKQKDGYLERVL